MISRKATITLLELLICLFVVNAAECVKKHRVRQYDAKIMDRPDEVPVVKCGDDIRLTCIAEGEPTPEIEWWYKNPTGEDAGHGPLIKAAREGRVKIKTEKFYVIRSTLIIRKAEETDEGMYQCRASNSDRRKHQNINLLQHWVVEEAPVHKVMCRDTVLAHTEVYPDTKYNDTAVTEKTEKALSSLGLTSSTSSTPSEEKRIGNAIPVMKTSQMTSSTTVVTVKPVKPLKAAGPGINNIGKPVNSGKRKHTRRVLEREGQNSEKVIRLQQNNNNNNEGIPASGTTLEEGGEGDENSGLGVNQRSWLMMLILQIPIATFVLLTSSW